jgi:hypothetical protein
VRELSSTSMVFKLWGPETKMVLIYCVYIRIIPGTGVEHPERDRLCDPSFLPTTSKLQQKQLIYRQRGLSG